jgi:DNA-binding NarL/FixJ family response regulator
MPALRLLVVDDHAIVRRSICFLLAQELTLDVICQTTSGEDAVTKAEELQPDMVLLDIGLPGINGIEAARQIRNVSPKSRIIFLSQHDSLQSP